MLSQHYLHRWRWSVLTEQVAAVQRLGLPLCPFGQRHPVMAVAARWAFWGLLLGAGMALILIGLFDLPRGPLRATACWSLPICVSSFAGWLGGMRGLTLDHPAVVGFLPNIAAGRHVVLLDVKDVDQRLVKRVMAMAGARKVGEHPLGLRWARIFPPRGEHSE